MSSYITNKFRSIYNNCKEDINENKYKYCKYGFYTICSGIIIYKFTTLYIENCKYKEMINLIEENNLDTKKYLNDLINSKLFDIYSPSVIKNDLIRMAEKRLEQIKNIINKN
jgi:hypothetical protein